jgi:hypothetical protein
MFLSNENLTRKSNQCSMFNLLSSDPKVTASYFRLHRLCVETGDRIPPVLGSGSEKHSDAKSRPCVLTAVHGQSRIDNQTAELRNR